MSDNLGRDALADLALGLWVDRQGEIGVGLDVDKAGRDRQPCGVDNPLGRTRQIAPDLRDAAVGDRHIAPLARSAAAVIERAAADQDVPGHANPHSPIIPATAGIHGAASPGPSGYILRSMHGASMRL